MPSIDLFQPRAEDAVRAALLDAKAQARHDLRELYEMAVDYMNNRQLDDVERELAARYERTQTGDIGGQITPQVLPLTERYVVEAANAYNKPVQRKLVNPDGSTDEERTDEYNAMLRAARYDEHMHLLEQYTVLLRSCGFWYQARAGRVRPVIVLPHDIWPVLADDDWALASDQNDYAGHVVELFSQAQGEHRAAKRKFVWLSPAEAAFYEGGEPFSPWSDPVIYGNVFRWPQTVDGEGYVGEVQTLPLQMLTFWHHRLPQGELIVDTDPAIALCNRELNLQLSILLDTLAHQGWATLLLNLLNPDAPPATFSAGPRSGLALGVGESASMVSAGISFTDMVGVLTMWVKLLAMAMRQSPNDFSPDAPAAASGFAKLVDSLPKIEARQERIRRLEATEATVAYPRLAAIGANLGLLSGTVEQLAQLEHHVEFAPIEFPKNIPERNAEEEHDIKHGLTTPAKILAKRKGITLEQAEQELAENMAAKLPPPGAPMPGSQPAEQGPGPGGLLGQLLAKRGPKAGAAQ